MASAIERVASPHSNAMAHWQLVLAAGETTWSGSFPADDDQAEEFEIFQQLLVDIQIAAGNAANIKIKPYSVGTAVDGGGKESAAITAADMPAEPADLEGVRKIGLTITGNDGDLVILLTALKPSRTGG